MSMTGLAVATQSWTTEQLASITDRLLPTTTTTDDDDGDAATRLDAWVVILGVFVLAAAVAWAVCLNKGYRGFTGEIKLHTKWRVPIGIKLECY